MRLLCRCGADKPIQPFASNTTLEWYGHCALSATPNRGPIVEVDKVILIRNRKFVFGRFLRNASGGVKDSRGRGETGRRIGLKIR